MTGARAKTFKFLGDVGRYSPSDAFVVRIQGDISSKDKLLHALYEKLDLPGYFGFNWDALVDCLRDFHWVAKKRIVIAHENIPPLGGQELKIYLEILADSVLDWKPGDEHELEVVFPESTRDRIETLLGEANRDGE